MARNVKRCDLVFQLSCWGLGAIAFLQLLFAGVALAVRMERAQEVKIVEKVVPKLITVMPAPAAPAVAVAPIPPRPVELPPMPEATPLPAPRPLALPPIADPVVERLVTEARKARLSDDMANAILKLESAHERAPKDPSVLYELGLVYEEMAVAEPMLAERAADAFLEVMGLGASTAGELYLLASKKIESGAAMPADRRGEIALGRPRLFPDKEYQDGERVVLTVPIQGNASTPVDEGDLEVRVTFYDSLMRRGKREIVQTEVGVKEENVQYVTLPFDFATGEELVRFVYILPKDEARDEAIFGRRKYYGQVVELIYKGEVLDAQAWPRHLASLNPAAARNEMSHPFDQMPEFLDSEMYNEAAPLLPNPDMDFLPEPPPITPGDLPPPPGE